MRSGHKPHIGAGGPSILTILVLLCLTAFASISMASARAYQTLTQKTADACSAYYAADGNAEEILASQYEERNPLHILEILTDAVRQKASDIFIIAGRPVTYKINERLLPATGDILRCADTETLITGLYALSDRRAPQKAEERGDDDFAVMVPQLSRFRASIYRQRGSLAGVIRVISYQIPSPRELGIPDKVMCLAEKRAGLILVTGPAGSGKSTTLACLTDRINQSRSGHIITLEDPVEYLHSHGESIVSQREIGTDSESYLDGLRSSLRQSPNVILLGEMRDYETIKVAMTAAETGHLILSSLHTMSAASTIDRIIDAFPHGQQQIRAQLAMVLQAVVSQQLIPSVEGGVVPVFEVMLANSAIRNMIRESKTHQLDMVIQSSSGEGMQSMNSSILELSRRGIISREDALAYSVHPGTAC